MSLITTLQELLDASGHLLGRVESATVILSEQKISLSAVPAINEPFAELTTQLAKASAVVTDASGLVDDLASAASDLCYALEGQQVRTVNGVRALSIALGLGEPMVRLRVVSDLVRGIQRDENGWPRLSPITEEVQRFSPETLAEFGIKEPARERMA